MIHQKFDKIYTKQYIDEFLANLPNCDVEKALRELSYINASAFKGYGKLSADLLSYNDMIYTAKESALRILVDKFKGEIKVHEFVTIQQRFLQDDCLIMVNLWCARMIRTRELGRSKV